MRVFFTCLALDEDHPILSHVTGWVRRFARTDGVEAITVVSPLVGRFDAPANVRVRSIKRRGRISTLLAFYREVLAAQRRGVDAFFVCQGGPYPALLLPIRLLTRKPVFQWKAHALVTPREQFYARYCDTRLFTATESSFPVPLPTRRIVGHGIDTSLFRPVEAKNPEGLATAGRVAPVKKMERMIDLVALFRDRHGIVCPLHIYGPIEGRDREYHRSLLRKADRLGLAESVHFHGAVPRSDMPAMLSRHRVFLHFCIGALDKATLEAMACGVPVLSDNPCIAEALPSTLRERLFVSDTGLEGAEDQLQALLTMTNVERAALAETLRANVMAHHDLDRLFERIVEEMRAAGVD